MAAPGVQVQPPVTIGVKKPLTTSRETMSRSQELTDTKHELRTTMMKFRKACTQLNLLNKRLSDMQCRMQAARKSGGRRSVYNLQLQASVTEGVRAMFYEYVYMRGEDIAMFQNDVRVLMKKMAEATEVAEQGDSETEDDQ
ncbi:hypothetical protein MAR_008890 [Mya arenaria]|uniref:Uncharacterized protein n=1 Tax=Mya arenaria TaxID=6604 RepID=A0ABY7DX66_MYAAR|nr:hypothetical protein MAR_008890 [Mya arenaria]